MTDLTVVSNHEIGKFEPRGVPALFADAGERAAYRYLEFFTASIRNPNTRAAYGRAVYRFTDWCQEKGIDLLQLNPVLVAAYVEELGQVLAKPTVEEMKAFFEAIPTGNLSGLRDRALIGVMVYSFDRVGAVVGMNIEDYVQQGHRMFFRFHEKGGKLHQVPAHHTAEEYLDAYIEAAGLDGAEKKSPLFRSFNHKQQQLTGRRLRRTKVVEMVKRRARQAGLADNISCHIFRATGITTYLLNGSTLEHAQQIAAHESPKTTKLYDHTSNEVSLDEIERIHF